MSEQDGLREPDQLGGVLLPEQQGTVVGHTHVQEAIGRLLTAGRLPGGILLHGPQGIGKATLAFATARAVLTATGDEDAHRVDEQVRSGSHPNLFVLRRQLNDTGRNYRTVIRVEQIRELRERMHRTRGRAGHRLAIIDPIDDCNPSAANALLKLLEEPPTETMFLLVSHRPRALLPTIRSRCQSIALRPMPDGEVRTVLEGQRSHASPAALDRAVELAEGRPRRGFEALELSEGSAIGALKGWLADPSRPPTAAHLLLADGIAGGKDGAEQAFARDLLLDWIAAEARSAAQDRAQRARLASANALWEKASAAFADADEYNLDLRQTLIGIFDAIKRHVQPEASVAESR